ncbi:MAG: AAA family ATPase [Acidimicrobiia bacterium]
MPFYLARGNEKDAIRAAHRSLLPVMLTGPTGCGKTRLVHHMAAELGRPVVTVTCHDDLTSGDLVGRYLVVGGDVRWIDGPLTVAVRTGSVCYLDEVAEARRDTLAVLHSLLDDRRALYLERTGEVLEAPPDFMLIASYNPSSRSLLKELKPSFRQRFVTLALDYLPPADEQDVVERESGVDGEVAGRLVRAATALRQAQAGGVSEVPSTRVLVAAARLVAAGLPEEAAIDLGVLNPLSAAPPVEEALRELLRAAGVTSPTTAR